MPDGSAASGLDVQSEAFRHLIGQGVLGTLLVIMLFAIWYLQRKRDQDTDARIREGRESVLSIAEVNAILKSVKEAMSALAQSDAGLSGTVLTATTEIKAVLATVSTRLDRIERESEQTNDKIQNIEGVLRDLRNSVDRACAGQWRDGAPR